MLKKRPDNYFVKLNTPDSDLPDSVKIAFNILKRRYGFGARISDFIQLLECAMSDKFDSFDEYTWNNAQFQSFLMDKQIKFMRGDAIDLADIHSEILRAFDLGISEQKMMLERNIEELVWAVFLIIADPSHPYFNT